MISRLLRLFKRPPDFIIGERDRPYMLRWYVVPRNRWFNIYLHCICRSDDDRALHDHPWSSLSLVLAGRYHETTPTARRWYARGAIVWRTADHRHRLTLLQGERAWTLFITGPKVRDWGFWCPKGFVPWQDFVAPSDSGQIGRGCGEH